MKLIGDENLLILECSFHDREVARYLGFKWDAEIKCWYSSVKKHNKKIKDYTDQDFIKIKNRLQENIELSYSTDADIDIPKPDGLEYLPFQKAGVSFINRNKQVLLGDEMGLGKTIQAIGYLNLKQFKNTLIITTASLKLNWQKEIDRWKCFDTEIHILDSSKKFDYKSGILIVNYDILSKFEDYLKKAKFDYVVADEVHYVKNKKAQRSNSFYKIVSSIENKVYLSGTPIVDKPVDLYNIIKSLGYSETKSSFQNMYCGMYFNGFAMVPGTPTNLDQLQHVLRSRFMIRRMKKDVLKDLPDKFKQIIYVEDKKSLKLEQQAISQFLNIDNLSSDQYNEFIDSTNFSQPGFIGLIAEIRKQNAITKLPFAINIIKEILESKDKVVVFAHHKEVIDTLMNEFKDTAVKLDGRTSMQDRQKAVDDFQNKKEIKIFVGSILASGTGITLTASNHCIFIEMDWTPSNMMQAEDRLHRIGQKNNVTIQYIVVDNSIDSMVAKKLVKKESIFNKIFN